MRGSDGRVLVPAAEYDPVTYAPLSEMVEVSSVGTVLSWTWQAEPLDGQPLDRPFAWALIKLDGADTALLHAVDGEVKTGDRVGLVGVNGAGKSTQLRLIAGLEEPSTGQVVRQGNPRIVYLRQEFDVDLERSVREELFQAFGEAAEVLIRQHRV